MIAYMAIEAARKGRRVIILVHRNKLLKQLCRHFSKLGVSYGRISAQSSFHTKDLIQVASVQTLVRRLDRIPAPDLLMIDEAHYAQASSWQKIVAWSQAAERPAMLLGLTATPWRLDGKGLSVSAGGCFDDLVIGATMPQLIELGLLSPFDIYVPETVEIEGANIIGGDYSAKDIESKMENSTIIGNAVEYYQKLTPGLPAIVFSPTVKHAETVAAQFRASGWDFHCIDGKMDYGQQDRLLDQLDEGKIHGLTSCQLITTGTDIRRVSNIIQLRHTLSLTLYLQMLGRGSRTFPGKETCVVQDHVGNWRRHGWPDQVREWSLDGQKKSKRKLEAEVEIKQCKSCYMIYPANVARCPKCGSAPKVLHRPPPPEVDGRLVKLEKQAQEQLRRNQMSTAQTLAELQEIEKKRGYKQGWAKHVWDARVAKREKRKTG